ncbi:hypothetical protein COU77_00450 [Candidatus Peregrinibacteria bacterium CG10_big_fil_rev_8_21_14_0_10_49_16]|nr:MAG: hypothetical protein COW95_00465 [Candidatus Peregrinibacteria bacterium CG22_combo_CG10-13_8_21_14_all_49_11]PIR52415.1 MAG: hypothetical protein COU77_00450 [Candidatus Peregrinibacteria bacterium CG10_big_fil_rev_8_21_14_0_10_49_16]
MRHGHLIILWLLTDMILFIGLFVLAYFLRVGFIFSTDFPFDRFLTTTLLITPLWLSALISTRTFALMRRQTSIRNGLHIAFCAVIGTALFALTYYFLHGAFFSRLLLVQALLLTWGIIWMWHMLFSHVLHYVLRKTNTFPVLVVGVTRESMRLIDLLQKKKSPLKPVAILDGRGVKERDIHGVPVKGKLNKLEDVLQEDHITHLIQCSDLEQTINLLSACRNKGITYMNLPSLLGIVERDERVDRLEGQPVTIVSPKDKWWKWPFQ